MNESYNDHARAAILAAVNAEHDFGGWLAGVLASVAAELGSSDALTAGRPGSLEADLVQRLVKGTVGWADEYLTNHRQLQTETTAWLDPSREGHRGHHESGGTNHEARSRGLP
jgi:hypothetical protein